MNARWKILRAEVCRRTEITRASCRKRFRTQIHRARNFGAWITADHKVPNEECEPRNGHRYAVVVQDLATQWLLAYAGNGHESAKISRAEGQSESDVY